MADDYVAPRTFRIWNSQSPPLLTFRAEFGDGSPLVIDGYGGWNVRAIPRRRGVTEWIGRNPIAVEIPFELNDLESGKGLENETYIARLGRLCGLGSSTEQPPICIVDGGGVIPHDLKNSPDLVWVIEGVSWDRSIEVRNNAGNRVRAGGSITIRQWSQPSVLTALTLKKGKLYTVKKGESLVSIAAKQYGNSRLWTVIGKANGIRDPKKIKENQKIILP